MEVAFDSVHDLQKLCRLCMETETELYSVYGLTPLNEIGDHVQFVEMILECTSLKIKSGDGLPEAICLQCSHYLETSYNFKQRCEKSDRKLRELIKVLEEGKKSTIENKLKFDYNITLFSKNCNNHTVNIKHETTNILVSQVDTKLNSENEESNLPNDTVNNVNAKRKILLNPSVGVSKKLKTKQPKTKKAIDKQHKKDIHKQTKTNVKKKIKSQRPPTDSTRSKNLECSFCFKQFSSEINLKLHTNACQIRTIHCGLCSKDFSNTSMLKEHLTEIHCVESTINENHIYACDICDSVFSDEHKLLFHYRMHIGVAAYYPDATDDSSLICCHCNTHFTKVFDLETHINNHKTDENSFVCRICDFETTVDDVVKDHLKLHGLNTLICNLCLLSFISIRKFRLHLKAHKQINKLVHSCIICKKQFPTRNEIKNHIKFHLKDLQTCSTCSKSFKSPSEYESHQKEHNKSILCTVCGKLFPGKSRLDSHMLLHDGIKPFSCSQCDKSFRTKNILSNHELTHSDVKPYVCTWCGYSCKRSGDLHIHHRIHTGDRPYSCPFPGCHSTFTTSGIMNQHLRRHTGEGKTHKCELCKRTFFRNVSLKRHMLIHTNERPFKCDICDKSFRRRYYVTVHKSKVHEQ